MSGMDLDGFIVHAERLNEASARIFKLSPRKILLQNSFSVPLVFVFHLHPQTPFITTMKFSLVLASVALLLPSLSGAVKLQYDNTYDNRNTALTSVSCSDGANGLITRFGFQKFGDIPQFPHIGATSSVAGWNSDQCGTCWKLSYTNGSGKTKSIHVLAVDHAGSGWNVAQAAMDELTGGQAVALGNVDVTEKKVAVSHCGL
ncbi:Cerato-platanin-domain-containing protein [Dendrothele bispora CBS 962.96]|uniref:Cerato-platanin-domain-containing protein n=1 Tax=Dendrothele bispora (strain CBS 962.96) TaxID=1314807 RepID=A0A4S8M633_DENBC|nr:Cerato-platanin-domain-containing protein [Dendrothele bispora CBS 962.96]